MLDFIFRRSAKPSSGCSLPVRRFHPSSYADPNGRLYSADGRLYRGLTDSGAELGRKLFANGVIDELVAKKLIVNTWISDSVNTDFPLVLEHEQVPFVSYPYEWGAEMLRVAALHTLDLLEALAVHGYTLRDAHGWNVVFEGWRPVFVDFGSIIAAEPGDEWQAETEFQEYFLHPLAMMGGGHDRIARALLRDFELGVTMKNCESIAGLGVPQRPEGVISYAWYRELISGYDFKTGKTTWSDYYLNDFPSLTPSENWSGKHHAVARILADQVPVSVLDVGSNSGWYSLYAAACGARVVAFDNDVPCVNQLYRHAREIDADIQPLVLSFVNPSPRYGLAAGTMEAAVERLKCDLVLALAIVHHLVFRMHLTFPQIADGLAAYTTRTLVVEFPPAEDVHVRQWMSERYNWYTLDGFKKALRRHFTHVRVVDSDPSPRVILVCER